MNCLFRPIDQCGCLSTVAMRQSCGRSPRGKNTPPSTLPSKQMKRALLLGDRVGGRPWQSMEDGYDSKRLLPAKETTHETCTQNLSKVGDAVCTRAQHCTAHHRRGRGGGGLHMCAAPRENGKPSVVLRCDTWAMGNLGAFCFVVSGLDSTQRQHLMEWRCLSTRFCAGWREEGTVLPSVV
jgi:hypothetical protein